MQQYHSQKRKTLLCQLLWGVDIKTQTSKQKPQTSSAKRYYFSHTKGKSLWKCLPYSGPHISAETKAFHTKAWAVSWVGKLRDTAFIPTLPALPAPGGPMAQTVLLSACTEPHVVQENRENTDGVCDWHRALLGHKQEGDCITSVYCSRSMAASAYFLCSTSFPARKTGLSAFRNRWILCQETTM